MQSTTVCGKLPAGAAVLATLWLAVICGGAGAATREVRQRPNIIFILLDDLRWNELGITGHAAAQTPHIDRIGREGAVFRNFFATTPLCSPSRASFLTGLYAHHHRIINNDKVGHAEVSHTLVTFPRVLREAGYETAFIGKWHMGLDDSRRPGFDRWVSFRGQGLYIDPVINFDGIPKQMDGYTTDILNEEAVRFLQQKREKPFVLCLSHKAVHVPYLPAARHESLYADFEYSPPASAGDDLSGKPALTRKVAKVDVLRLEGAVPEPAEPRRGRGQDRTSVVRDHLRTLAAVDEGVARIFDTLEATSQLDNTAIVFAGDNGYLLGEHGQFDQKRWAYEESIRIPFLMRYPRLIRAGTQYQQMVLNIDLAPTLYELAGVESIIKVDGRSFLPILTNAQAPWRDSFFAEYFVEKVGERCPDWQAVRQRDWKYIHYPTLDGMDEVYNLAADPYELNNLIDDQSSAGQVGRLRQELEKLRPPR